VLPQQCATRGARTTYFKVRFELSVALFPRARRMAVLQTIDIDILAGTEGVEQALRARGLLLKRRIIRVRGRLAALGRVDVAPRVAAPRAVLVHVGPDLVARPRVGASRRSAGVPAAIAVELVWGVGGGGMSYPLSRAPLHSHNPYPLCICFSYGSYPCLTPGAPLRGEADRGGVQAGVLPCARARGGHSCRGVEKQSERCQKVEHRAPH
jgi:hypothetical protein